MKPSSNHALISLWQALMRQALFFPRPPSCWALNVMFYLVTQWRCQSRVKRSDQYVMNLLLQYMHAHVGCVRIHGSLFAGSLKMTYFDGLDTDCQTTRVIRVDFDVRAVLIVFTENTSTSLCYFGWIHVNLISFKRDSLTPVAEFKPQFLLFSLTLGLPSHRDEQRGDTKLCRFWIFARK